jgi:fibronectin-binding autotransporter adhesin
LGVFIHTLCGYLKVQNKFKQKIPMNKDSASRFFTMSRPIYHLPLVLSLALVCLAPIPSMASTLTVTNLNDSGAGSLRDTIVASASGDTINFAVTGTITLTSANLYINHDLTITGPGAANLNIQRSTASGTAQFRIFFFDNGTWNLSGVTISNGNDISAGGGIYNGNGNLTVTDCVISGNFATQTGGGIENHATLTVQNCTINGNTGGHQGGGIFNQGTLTVNNCTITGNLTNAGGAIYNATSHSVTVSNCTLSNNPALNDGGGIDNEFGNMTVTNCTISGNAVGARGGGILYDGGTLTVKSCTVSGNSATTGGGICTQNRLGAAVNLGNTILKTGSSGVNLVNGGSAIHVVTITSLGYNLSDDNGAGFLTGPGDQINTDPKLDPAGLQSNGGPTQTIALTDGSPAIDQGTSFGLTTDQRGQPRPFDNPSIPNAPGGDGSDIGAYEAGADPEQGGPTLIVTTTDDHNDGVCGGTDCTLREAIQSVSVGRGNTITFANGVTGTITLQGILGQLDINVSTTITGPGARLLAISGNGASRVFSLSAGSSTISGLTIRDGNGVGAPMGAAGSGGGIWLNNQAALTLNDCALSNNSVVGLGSICNGCSGGPGRGGAIYSGGALTLNRCTFSGNAASGANGNPNSSQFSTGGSGGAGQGGAVFDDTTGTLSIDNCTFNGNSVTGGIGGHGTHFGGAGGNGNGGALFNLGTMTVTAATVSGNTGSGGAGGTGSSSFFNGAAGVGSGGLAAGSGSGSTVRNTISAGNTGNNGGGADADGAFASNGYNLIGIGDFSSGFTNTGDQVGTTAAPINAKLGPLQNNGGPTNTIAPLANSSAIDQGKSFGLTTDQRGMTRPFDEPSIPNASGGDGSDIGAVEINTQFGPTFVVTTTADHDDGTCTSGDCTLREAINAANAASGPNTITFAPGVTGTITLQAALGVLSITDSTTIIGPGARVLAVSGNGVTSVFGLSAGTTAISGLTISGGVVIGPPAGLAIGGGIFNQATLTLSDCALSGNQARGGDNTSAGGNGGDAAGGAIANSGVLTLKRCTFSGNAATGGLGGNNSASFSNGGHGGAGEGGVVFNNASATLAINNCTFNGNSATGKAGGTGTHLGGSGGNGSGGGVFNLGMMTVTAATLNGNTGSGGAGGTGSSKFTNGSPGVGTGGLAAGGGSSTVGDTISAGNTGTNGGGADADGTFSSNGYNFIGTGDHSTGFTNGANHDQVGTDTMRINPNLGPLQNNGGPTDTMALLSNTPPTAINSGDPNAPAQDQRYYLRSGVPDIGAFEFGGALAPISAVSRKTHGTVGDFDITLPLTGISGIECRTGGATNDHRLIVTFPAAVTVSGTPQAQVTSGTGQIGTGGNSNGGVVTLDQTKTIMTVPLTNVTNAQRLVVTLFSVGDGVNTNNVTVPMGVLAGDTTANGAVNSSDIAQTQSQSGQLVTSSNFREDVTVNGSINSSDIALVQSKSGTALPVAASQSQEDPTTTAPKHRGSPEKSF